MTTCLPGRETSDEKGPVEAFSVSHPGCEETFVPTLLRKCIPQYGDGPGVPPEVLGMDGVDRVGLGVVDVEVVVAVGLEVQGHCAQLDHRPDVGPEGAWLEATDAEAAE